MSHYITIPLTEIMLKAGDRVRLVEPEVLIERSNSDIQYQNDNGIYSFELERDYISFGTVDVDDEMLTLLHKWDTQEIESIDADGDIKFVDMDYTWPKEVILEPVDENDKPIRSYIDSSKIDYVRIYRDEVGGGAFKLYCNMPHAIISEEEDRASVYFYTISQNNVNPLKQLKAGE
mgnify:CR=1 FL=1